MEIQNVVNRGSVQDLTYDPGSKDSEATTFGRRIHGLNAKDK